ncbi:hypothetical protein ILUMI_25093, partial [Ignelater luminosus]
MPTAKSFASNQSTSEIIILEAETSNTDTALAMESDSARDKRKHNQSGSTDTGSAREDDLSVIDSSAESSIQGNEVADNAAKSAAADSVTDEVAVRMEDLRNICKKRILRQWQLDWNNSNAKLKQIKPEVGKTIYPTDLNRREQV